MKTLTLTSEYSIEKRKGYTLMYTSDELVPKKNHKTGETNMKPMVAEYYYGTLYGALQGFLKQYASNSESLVEVISRVNEALRIIDECCAEVEDKYKIVKVMQP